MRKTKIICTLGPSSSDESTLREMMRLGMNVCRFNFSHGTHEEHREKLSTVKRLREELKLPVATLLDTKGPEIRLRDFEGGSVVLAAGERFTITTREVMGDASIGSITYAGLPGDVTAGSRILIDDGLVELVVESIQDTDIHCTVKNGGKISNHKGINVPGVSLSIPYLSEADKADLLFGIREGFDFVAASFVRSAQDVLAIKDFLGENGGRHIKIISKIENAEGVQNLDEILAVSGGIMVARGDLGVEVDMQEIPVLQKMMIRKCYTAGKVVITATQMLESMSTHPRPTRAEVNDVANAIYDGTSAIMLSGETAAGQYPLEALKTMATVAERTERDINYQARFRRRDSGPVTSNITDAISHATCTTALDIGAAAIIPISKSGRTARMVSKYRCSIPIIGCTTDEVTYRQLAITWGVIPVMCPEQPDTDTLFTAAVQSALEQSHILQDGDLVVLTAGLPLGVSGTTNLLKVQTVGSTFLRGRGLNALSAAGPVCVGHTTQEVQGNFAFGDILVCRRAELALLKQMFSAAAVITEESDPESDQLLESIKGQLNVPVIVGVRDCTRLLRTGETVELSAAKGIITPLKV
ncbi:MAG: pyruvate kinase [Angelakisella sp.]|jgi:pyruvate kinase|nr:pyruvate kinase [Angelakisella sp.]